MIDFARKRRDALRYRTWSSQLCAHRHIFSPGVVLSQAVRISYFFYYYYKAPRRGGVLRGFKHFKFITAESIGLVDTFQLLPDKKYDFRRLYTVKGSSEYERTIGISPTVSNVSLDVNSTYRSSDRVESRRDLSTWSPFANCSLIRTYYRIELD